MSRHEERAASEDGDTPLRDATLKIRHYYSDMMPLLMMLRGMRTTIRVAYAHTLR